ncbi:MAG TPA: MATE family efflux transporter [Fimbriimonas sp.]|nr:MATE family efflux transporter [Fimbriimonas sp.]
MAVADISLESESTVAENSALVVWALAWPAVLLNSLQVINTLLDRFFTGTLPSAALTAYGASTVVTFLMFSLGMALATGATAIVSRAFGAENADEYRRGAQESLSLSVFGGIGIGLLTASIAGFASSLVLPSHDSAAIGHMTRFLTAYAFGLPALFIIQTLAGSLRGIGDTKSPMYISGIQICLHITLNFFLIFPTRHFAGVTVPGAGLGLTGAACALAGSAWISAIGYVIYIRRTPLGPLSPFRVPDSHWAFRILRIAIPAGVMATLRVFSLGAFTLVLKQVSDASAAIAAMSIGFALESIMFMPPFGLSAAAAALVGQSLGMKKPDRAERLAWTAAHHAALVTVAVAFPLFVSAMFVAMGLTSGKADISSDAALLLRCLCGTEFLFAYAMVLMGAMQGAGDTVRPLWITVFCLWGLRVPLAAVFALPHGFRLGGVVPLPVGFGWGTPGAWVAMSATQGLQGVLAMIAFKLGHWKTEKV